MIYKYKWFWTIFLSLYAFLLWPNFSAAQEVPSQFTQGNSSPVQSNIYGNNYANYGKTVNIVVRNYNLQGKNNSYESKQEALLLAKNPTALSISGIEWFSWFGDKIPFMNIEIENISELPALNVRVSVLDPNTGDTLKKLKPYRLTKSYAQKLQDGYLISIGGKSKYKLPVASSKDIEKITYSDCITGAGLGFPPNRTANFDDFQPGSSSARHILLYFKINYSTIFGESIEQIVSGVVDAADRRSTHMVSRETGKWVKLSCIGDAE